MNSTNRFSIDQLDGYTPHMKWFHVLEDEINHRGQIRLMRKRLPTDL